LREVFGFGGIARHPETKGIYAPLMQSIEILEGNRISILRPLNRLRFTH
jgi:hypothetical protein